MMLVSVAGPNIDPVKSNQGDIEAVIPMQRGVGRMEMCRWLYIPAEGLDLGLPFDVVGDELYAKRYCLRDFVFTSLIQDFSFERMRNVNDCYQPFIVLDQNSGLFIKPIIAYNLAGLVWDKIDLRFV